MKRHRGMAGSAVGASNVVDEALFRFLVDLEVSKASRLQYCVSLVSVALSDGENQMDPAFAERAAEAVSRHCRATDVVTNTAPASVSLLLVAAETRDLPEIFRRTATELEAHASVAGPARPTVWSGGGACYPQTAMNGSDLLGQAAELTVEARRRRAGTLILPA